MYIGVQCWIVTQPRTKKWETGETEAGNRSSGSRSWRCRRAHFSRLRRNQPLNNQDKHRQPAGIQQQEIRHRVMHQLGTLQQNQAAAGGKKKRKKNRGVWCMVMHVIQQEITLKFNETSSRNTANELRRWRSESGEAGKRTAARSKKKNVYMYVHSNRWGGVEKYGEHMNRIYSRWTGSGRLGAAPRFSNRWASVKYLQRQEIRGSYSSRG